MKKILAISLVSFLASCGGGNDDVDTFSSGLSNGTVAEGSTAPGATTAAESSVFLTSAYQDGAAEIALSKLALDKATNEEVRIFAQRMIDDHTQVNEEIRALAQANGITLPTALTDEANSVLQNLTNLTGPEFDKAYMQHNVTVHERDVGLFREQIAAAEAETSGNNGGTTGATANAGTGSGSTTANAGVNGSTTGVDTSGGSANVNVGTPTGSTTVGAGTNGSTTGVDTSGGSANVNVGTSTDATTTGAAGTGAASSLDASIRTFAENTLPVLQVHLLAAKGLNGSINPSAFLVNLYQDGLDEILLSRLALEKASNPEVRAYAQQMITDHTAANNQITQLAQTKGVTLPTEATAADKAAYEDIADLEGADFEKAYMNHNVLVHELAVAQAEAQSEGGTDTEIKTYAATILPILSAHRDNARRIYEAIEPSLLFTGFQDGIGEILLSKLALQKSSDSRVRELAQTIIDDHTGVQAEIRQLAQRENTALPRELSAEQVRAYLELLPLSGAEFDKAYVQRNATVRNQNVQMIQQRATGVTDTEVRALLDKALSVLSRQVSLAEGLASSASNNTEVPES